MASHGYMVTNKFYGAGLSKCRLDLLLMLLLFFFFNLV